MMEQQFRAFGGKAEGDKYLAGKAGLAQLHPLPQFCDPEMAATGPGKGSGGRDQAMAIGIGFDHRHHRHPGDSANSGKVVLEGEGVYADGVIGLVGHLFDST